MNAKLLSLALAFSLPALASSVETQRRTANGFQRVQLSGAANVHVKRGDFALSVSAPGDELGQIETKVENGALVIETHGHHLDGPIDVSVSMPAFAGAALAGAGDLDVAGFDQAGAVELTLKGAGDVRYAGSARSMKIELAGAGDVTLESGKLDRLEVSLRGIGHVRAAQSPARDAKVFVSGTGEVDFTANGGGVELELSGLGSIHWKGDAKVLSERTSGLGHIEHG
jgi:hypothetical protein